MDPNGVIYKRIIYDASLPEEEPEPPVVNTNSSQEEVERSEDVKVNDLFRAGKKALYKISTFFPFDMFPDDLMIDSIKVNHVRRIFFFTEQVNTYLLENIKSVTMENFLMFSKLVFYDDKTLNTGVVIGPFIKKDALRAYNIIQGLMATLKRKVDITRIESKRDIDKIAQIGMATLN